MPLPDDLRPSYHDPQLWLRLGPRVEKHLEEKCADVLARRAQSWDHHIAGMAYIEGLRWVLKESKDLTRVEEHREKDD